MQIALLLSQGELAEFKFKWIFHVVQVCTDQFWIVILEELWPTSLFIQGQSQGGKSLLSLLPVLSLYHLDWLDFSLTPTELTASMQMWQCDINVVRQLFGWMHPF